MHDNCAVMLPLPASLVVLLLVIHAGFSSAASDGQQFVYQGFSSANLSLDGLAVVTPDGLLALTNATHQAKGHAFHPSPLHFLTKNNNKKKARSFSTCFVFAILSPYDALSDYGLAFVVSPTTNFSTAKPGQYLGLLNATNGTASHPVLAVELDTIINPEFRDINGNHVGIDLNSLVSAMAEPAGYYDDTSSGGGAWRNLTLNSHEPMLVWVDYDAEATQLNMTLAPVNVRRKATEIYCVYGRRSFQLFKANLNGGS